MTCAFVITYLFIYIPHRLQGCSIKCKNVVTKVGMAQRYTILNKIRKENEQGSCKQKLSGMKRKMITGHKVLQRLMIKTTYQTRISRA